MSASAVQLAPMAIAAVGSIVQGVSQAAQAKRSAGISEANAEEAERQGEAEAGLIRERARRLAGQNRAAIGASGVDISGSFADALEDSDISTELDAQTAIRNAKVQAKNFKAQARADRASAGSALVGAGFGAGTQALSGYGSWQRWKALTAGATDGSGWAGTMMGSDL